MNASLETANLSATLRSKMYKWGQTFAKSPFFCEIFFVLENFFFKNGLIFEAFGKMIFKLICQTYVYETFRDIIEKTDDEDNA